MNDAVRAEIAAIAADSRSGATAILSRAVGVLRAVAADRAALEDAARELCRAHPSMAGLHVVAALALRGPAADALDAFEARTTRAPRLIARFAADLLKLRSGTGALRIVTLSRSHAVEHTLLALARDVSIEVCCAESRPALEGRDLAVALAASGVRAVLFTDAGIGTALDGAEALLVGADAIGPDAFINKVGTTALAALAGVRGVPTYVLAGREKILPAHLFAALTGRSGPTDEVAQGISGASIENPYFEWTPSSLVTTFVTEAGAVPPSDIAQASMI